MLDLPGDNAQRRNAHGTHMLIVRCLPVSQDIHVYCLALEARDVLYRELTTVDSRRRRSSTNWVANNV